MMQFIDLFLHDAQWFSWTVVFVPLAIAVLWALIRLIRLG